MQGFGYLAAAYAVVLVTLGGYALRLVLRERGLRRELGGDGRSQGG
jgi:CcmD family protein